MVEGMKHLILRGLLCVGVCITPFLLRYLLGDGICAVGILKKSVPNKLLCLTKVMLQPETSVSS